MKRLPGCVHPGICVSRICALFAMRRPCLSRTSHGGGSTGRVAGPPHSGSDKPKALLVIAHRLSSRHCAAADLPGSSSRHYGDTRRRGVGHYRDCQRTQRQRGGGQGGRFGQNWRGRRTAPEGRVVGLSLSARRRGRISNPLHFGTEQLGPENPFMTSWPLGQWKKRRTNLRAPS